MSKELQIEQELATNRAEQRIGLFTRQPLTVLGKVAFWTSFVGMLGGLGGTIALTITNGTPSRDIVTTTALSLVITVLIATGIRWMQVISALIGVANLYLIFTEPFVIESLADPKGPNGGYGHFIGDVIVIANALISFAALVGTLLQNYRLSSLKTPRWFVLVLGGVLGLVIGASFIGALAQPLAVPGLTYTNGVPTIHLSPGSFDVTSVTISKGSKLLLIDDTSERHVLANGTWQGTSPMQKREPGAPLVNSLSLSGNSVTIGPFNLAGTYHILCLLHRGMILTIIVQ